MTAAGEDQGIDSQRIDALQRKKDAEDAGESERGVRRQSGSTLERGMLIDLLQLRTFVTVAEEQHLTRAAERLHMSQSAASAHVRSIEESLGTQLLLRSNRGVELTKAGQLLLVQAKTLLNEAAHFKSFARRLRGETSGLLSVGTNSEPDTRIGEIVAALHDAHPNVMVDLRARSSTSARQGLRSGELDACVLLGEADDPAFTFYELTRVHFRLAGPVKWQKCIENADWPDLAQLPWIVPNDINSTYSGMVTALFARRGLEINVVAQFDSQGLGRAMLDAGVGLMLLREQYVQRGVHDGTLAASPIVHTSFPMSLAHQSSRGDDPLIRAFVAGATAVWSCVTAQQTTYTSL